MEAVINEALGWVLIWDRALFFWINDGWANPFCDVVVGGATWLGNAGVLAVIVLPALWALDRRRFWQNAFILVLALVLSGMASHLLKVLVHRPRPLKDMADLIAAGQVSIHVLWQPLRENSMPSGHANTVFAVATSLGFLYRRWIALFLSLAILTGLSRVYVGAHYPSDVIVGAFIGISGAVVVHIVHARWCRGRDGLGHSVVREQEMKKGITE
ncbi:MAG: phosphatase PAP2 family protein [Nitrospirae bacterium]|nr:phosphatase PAP2 family protein [Nitrospirota bacterium]